MNKWTLLALVAFLAVVGGGYYLLSQRQERAATIDGNGDLDVEDFDAEEGLDSDKTDNTYDMLDNADASGGADQAPQPKNQATKGIETIEDEEEKGQTVKDPEVIDDNDEESMDANKSKP